MKERLPFLKQSTLSRLHYLVEIMTKAEELGCKLNPSLVPGRVSGFAEEPAVQEALIKAMKTSDLQTLLSLR